MADAWIGINSSHIDSKCGEEGDGTLADALDGTDQWDHDVSEVHWFILDLGQTYTIKKVRGRSDWVRDPTDVDIYVSNDKEDWGEARATGISTWEDCGAAPIDWVEVDTTDRDGRYIKVVINATEDGVGGMISWGDSPACTIFDAYGSVVAVGWTGKIMGVTNPAKIMGVAVADIKSVMGVE